MAGCGRRELNGFIIVVMGRIGWTIHSPNLQFVIQILHLDLVDATPKRDVISVTVSHSPQTIQIPSSLLRNSCSPAFLPYIMAPGSPPTSQHQLVEVDTALAVLAKVNLLEESSALALDIGGSLAKLIYLQPYGSRTTAPPLVIHKVDGNIARALSVHVPELKGTLHFFAFETRNIHQLVRFIRTHWANDRAPNPEDHRLIRATGGGSYKYASTFMEEIGVQLVRLDEMSCTVAGLNFLLTTVNNEVYMYIPKHPSAGAAPSPGPAADFDRTTRFVDTTHNPFPYLLVNIGSGVSILKVTGHDTFERVSGSSLGGGTFWGLARMLLDCATFDDVISLTHDGDNANVDMLVGDIYGGSYASLGLDASIIAASFGKATMRNDSSRVPTASRASMKDRFIRAVTGSYDLWMAFCDSIPVFGSLLRAIRGGPYLSTPTALTSTNMGQQFRPQDVALALLRMVSYNIGQIAYLNARLYGLDRIYFGGNFVRNHPYTIADISFAVDFWSGGKTEALFLRHDGYLGAIGAFIGASSADPSDFVGKHCKRQKTPSSLHSKNENKSKNSQESKKQSPTLGDPEVEAPSRESSSASDKVDSDVTKTPQSSNEDSNLKEAKNADVVASSKRTADFSPKKTVNGTVRKTSTSQKRKRNKPAKSENSFPGATKTAGSEPNSSSVIAVENTNSVSHEANDRSDGDWTIVTRVRRKGAHKDKSS